MNKHVSPGGVLEDVSAHELGIVHIIMMRKVNNFRRQVLKDYGLSSADWLVLGIVDSTGDHGVRVTDVANSLGVKTTYITAALNRLRHMGLVSKKEHSEDGRAWLIVATKKGSDLAADIERVFRKKAKSLLNDPIIGSDFEDYIQILRKITKRYPIRTAGHI